MLGHCIAFPAWNNQVYYRGLLSQRTLPLICIFAQVGMMHAQGAGRFCGCPSCGSRPRAPPVHHVQDPAVEHDPCALSWTLHLRDTGQNALHVECILPLTDSSHRHYVAGRPCLLVSVIPSHSADTDQVLRIRARSSLCHDASALIHNQHCMRMP
jgi:hypothetical protein